MDLCQEIGIYAAEYGNKKAVGKFTSKSQRPLNESESMVQKGIHVLLTVCRRN